ATGSEGVVLYNRSTLVTSAEPENVPATTLMLFQNYPNPFNPATTIGFTIPVDGMTTLKIYNTLGQEVATLVNEPLKTGEYHQVQFDASALASGIYFARLQSAEHVQVKKLMLLK
ncbi:MAG: T9SS type A sorting domain-containing protein, partial [Bacteroidota bacterium]